MDKIVYHAWRVPHLGIDEMPPLPTKEEAEVLRQKNFKVKSKDVLLHECGLHLQ